MKYLLSLACISCFGAGFARALAIPPSRLSTRVCHFEEGQVLKRSYQPASSISRRAATTWDPPSNLVTPLEEVWEHEMSTYSEPLTFKNYGFDQVIAGGGKINYCVRWDSTESVTLAQRQAIGTAIARQFKKWIDELVGFDDFPYSAVDVNVVGWAVKDTSLLEGDVSDIDVYTTTDADGIPECDPRCGRYFHLDGDYSSCPSGADRHYDQSLWLTAGLDGGFGGDWGQQVGSEYFLTNIDNDNIHIVLHELGHTFALDDFYDWTPTGVTNFIMLAGSAMEITEFDAWMLRDWWRHLKSRYTLSSTITSASTTSATSVKASIQTSVQTSTPTSLQTSIRISAPTSAQTFAPTSVRLTVRPTAQATAEDAADSVIATTTEALGEIPAETPTEVSTEVPTEPSTETPSDVPTGVPTGLPSGIPFAFPTGTGGRSHTRTHFRLPGQTAGPRPWLGQY